MNQPIVHSSSCLRSSGSASPPFHPKDPANLSSNASCQLSLPGPEGQHLVLALLLRVALGFPSAATSPSEAGGRKVSGAGEQRGTGQRSGLCGVPSERLSFSGLGFLVSVITDHLKCFFKLQSHEWRQTGFVNCKVA